MAFLEVDDEVFVPLGNKGMPPIEDRRRRENPPNVDEAILALLARLSSRSLACNSRVCDL